MPTPPDPRAEAWYRQPILWLGAAVFAASLGGCIWMVVAGARHADTPLDTSRAVFGVPTSARSAQQPSP
jgi:hypothetical protein